MDAISSQRIIEKIDNRHIQRREVTNQQDLINNLVFDCIEKDGRTYMDCYSSVVFQLIQTT